MASRSLLIGIGLLALVAPGLAAPREEAIIALDTYSTEKGKALATGFTAELHQIYDRVDRCQPWLAIEAAGLGFTRPVGVSEDTRFLNIWVWVDERIPPDFAVLPRPERHSAMFSRHGVDLLRELAAHPTVFANPALSGYSVILTWLKPGNARVSETLGVFVDKVTVRAFLTKQLSPWEFIRRATIVAFDGKEALGHLPLELREYNQPGPREPGC